MGRKKITAVIPIRKGSKRVPDKNFISFYNEKNLLELKIQQLKEIYFLDNIVVNTDSEMAIDIAKKNGVEYFKRQDYFASSECSQSEFFENLAVTTESDIIIHTPCTSPTIKSKSIIEALNIFMLSDYDSCNSVCLLKEYLWLNNSPLNYNIAEGKVPNSQDLPDVVKLTFGFNIISRERMIERKNVVGENPLLYRISDIEGIDVDTKLDFRIAMNIYKDLAEGKI